MAGTLNQVHLLGRAGREPAMRYLPDGQAVTTFSLATDRLVGQGKPPETDWHRIVAFGKLAETLNSFVAKGRRLYIEGRLNYRTWTGENGQPHFGVDIVARQVLLLDRPAHAEGAEPEDAPADEPDLPF